MDVALAMFKPDGTRRDFPMRGGSMVLGRTNACDLRIPLSSVSRKHCELSVKGQAVLLRDLGSSNGTFHNGSRVQQARVQPGDEIAVGPVRFTLVVDGNPKDIKPPQPRQSSGPEDGDSAAGADIKNLDDSLSPVDPGETTEHPSSAVPLDAKPPAQPK